MQKMKKQLKKRCDFSFPNNSQQTRKIICGENKEVLELILPDYERKVKCIYIDPPYNNGDTYTHYDDSVYATWLKELEIRLRLLKKFLSDDGSIWISIDDSEVHYLKVMADSVFGRSNFVTTIIWQQRTTRENRKTFSNNHEYILVYAIDKKKFSTSVNKLPASKEMLDRYKNPDNDPKGLWQSVSLNVQAGHAVKSQFYEIVSPNGKIHAPPNGRCWAYNKDKMNLAIENNSVWFGQDGNGVPRLKKYLSESTMTMTPETLWLGSEVGTNKEAKKNLLKLFPNKPVFDTPKPERLLRRIFEIATNKGDLILDSYAGSGTSVAVAHKMKRQYIGIDQGEHIFDYTQKRLKKTDIAGEINFDEKEIGFEFFELI